MTKLKHLGDKMANKNNSSVPDPILKGKVRKDFYNAGDGIYGLQEYKEQLGPETQEAIRKLMQAHDELRAALQKEHKTWD